MTAPAETQIALRTPHLQPHPLSRRIMHWVNAVAILVMIGSGWRIYDCYPALPLHFAFPLYLARRCSRFSAVRTHRTARLINGTEGAVVQ